MLRTIDFGWGIPRVDQTAAADPIKISDVVAAMNRRLHECAGVAVVVQCCVAIEFIVANGGNESIAIAVRRYGLERGAEAGRKEVVLCIMY